MGLDPDPVKDPDIPFFTYIQSLKCFKKDNFLFIFYQFNPPPITSQPILLAPCVYINGGMPDCPASGQSGTGMKKITMPEQVRYRPKPTHFLVRYRCKIMEAVMPMPALVSSSMQMPMQVRDPNPVYCWCRVARNVLHQTYSGISNLLQPAQAEVV